MFVFGFGLGELFESFRFSDYRWIYRYGMLSSDLLVFGSIGWSLLHPIIIWSEKKSDLKKYLVWIFIGMIPILYFLLMMIFIDINIDKELT